MKSRVWTETEQERADVCLGTMTFGSQVEEAEAARMVDYAIDQGVRFLDTANVYNNGRSEAMLGRILRGRRAAVVLATKVRGKMRAGGETYEGLRRGAVRQAAEESLRRLGTDYLDIYYLHQPDRAVDIAETLDEMDRLRREGKIRWMGTSNYAAWQMAEIAAISRERGYADLAIAQPMYNVLARGIEQEYLAFTERYGVANVCYNPLAGGLLSGKQSLRSGPLPGTRFDGNEMYRKRFWHEEYFAAVEALRGAAKEAGVTLTELSLRWLCNQPGADSVILGASRFEHLRENLEAARKGPLPEGTLAACDEAWERLRGPTPAYNR